MTSKTQYSYKLISSLSQTVSKDVNVDRLKHLNRLVNDRLLAWLESKNIKSDCADLWGSILDVLNVKSKTPVSVFLTGSAQSYVQMSTAEIPEDIDFLITGISDAFLFTECFRTILGGEIKVRLSEFEFIDKCKGPIGEHFECNSLGISTVQRPEDLCSYYSVAHSTGIQIRPNIKIQSLITDLDASDACYFQKLCEETKVLLHFYPEKPRVWSRLLLLRTRGYKMVSAEFDKRVFLAMKRVGEVNLVKELNGLFKMHAKTKEEKQACVFLMLQQYKKYDTEDTFKHMYKACRDKYPELFPLEKLDMGVADAETGERIRAELHVLNPLLAETCFQTVYDDLCVRANEMQIKKSTITRFKENLLKIYPNLKDKNHKDVSDAIDFITRSLTSEKLTAQGATCLLYCVITSSDHSAALRDPESDVFKAIDRLTTVDLAVLRLDYSNSPINVLKKELDAMMRPSLYVLDSLNPNVTERKITQLLNIRARVHLLPDEVVQFKDRLFAAVFLNENLSAPFQYDILQAQLPVKVSAIAPSDIDERYVEQVVSFDDSGLTALIYDKLREKYTKNVTLLFALQTQPNTLSCLLRAFDIKLPQSASYSEKIARLIIAIKPTTIKTLPKELVDDFFVFPKLVRDALSVYFQADISRLKGVVKSIKTVDAVKLFFEYFMGANSVGRESEEVWSRLLNLAKENPGRRLAIYEQAQGMETNPVFVTLLEQCEKPKSMEHLKLFFEYVVVHFTSLNFTPVQKITFLNQYVTLRSETSAEIKYRVMNRLAKGLWQQCAVGEFTCSSRQRSAWVRLLREKTIYFNADLLVFLIRLKVDFNSLEPTDSLKKLVFEDQEICRCLTQSDPLFVLQRLDTEVFKKFPLAEDVVNLLIAYVDDVMRAVFVSRYGFCIPSFKVLPLDGVDVLCVNYPKQWRQFVSTAQKKVSRKVLEKVWQRAIYDELKITVLSLYMADEDWTEMTIALSVGGDEQPIQLLHALLRHEFYFLCSSIYQSIENAAVKKRMATQINSNVMFDLQFILEVDPEKTKLERDCRELFQKILSLMPVFESERAPDRTVHKFFSECVEMAVFLDPDMAIRMLAAFRKININFLPDADLYRDPYTVAVRNRVSSVIAYYQTHYPEITAPEALTVEAHAWEDYRCGPLTSTTPVLEKYKAILNALPNSAEAATQMSDIDLDLLAVSLRTLEIQVKKPGLYSNYVRIQDLFFEKFSTLYSAQDVESGLLNILNGHLLGLFEFAFQPSEHAADFVTELLRVIENSIQNSQYRCPLFMNATAVLHKLDKEELAPYLSVISKYMIKMLNGIMLRLDAKNKGERARVKADLHAFEWFTVGFFYEDKYALGLSIFGFNQSDKSCAFIRGFETQIKKCKKYFYDLEKLSKHEKQFAVELLNDISEQVLAHLNRILVHGVQLRSR